MQFFLSRIILSSILFLSILFSFGSAAAQEDKKNNYEKKAEDTSAYMEVIRTYLNAPPEEKLRGFKQFLEDNPDTSFKDEIKTNIENIEAVIRDADKSILADRASDHEDYEEFKAEIASLSPSNKISKYEDYIFEHTHSSIIEKIKADRDAIKTKFESNEKAPVKTVSKGLKPSPKESVVKDLPSEPITPQIELKDPQHALFLASVPGFFVPGIGSFYAGEMAAGITLILVRVTGIGLGIVGILNNNKALIVTGGLAYGLSWIVDIAAAPVFARGYNEKMEQKTTAGGLLPFISVADRGPLMGFSLKF